MFELRKLALFFTNIMLMASSWYFLRGGHGDEYLAIFMMALVFMIAPFVMNMDSVGILLSLTFAFLVFYMSEGVLNPIDVFTIMTMFVAISAICRLVATTHDLFERTRKKELKALQKRYNTLVNELENIDRRGRKIENELTRISRLYDVTTKLTPALTFQELLDYLFEFLEENMTFSRLHLMVFSGGEYKSALSRHAGPRGTESEEDELEYNEAVSYSRERDFKPSFSEVEKYPDLFQRLNVNSDTFMQFPLFVGERLSALLAIEGASRQSYSRLNMLISHIALEIRKVELYEKVQQLSIVDGLTDVYLRRYLLKRLTEEVDRSRRLDLRFSVGMVDVDHFKDCNDRYGHLVGDVVLSKIAERLRASVREVDLIARYGGEEFCIVLPETDKDPAVTVSERLRRSISSRPINAYGEKINITVSVGVATYPEDSSKVQGLIEKADMALYKAKRDGRDRVCTA